MRSCNLLFYILVNRSLHKNINIYIYMFILSIVHNTLTVLVSSTPIPLSDSETRIKSADISG